MYPPQLPSVLLSVPIQMSTLSIGMSDDFEAAITEGATLVRIGSALFGARITVSPPNPHP